jgi:hypothetical protein
MSAKRNALFDRVLTASLTTVMATLLAVSAAPAEAAKGKIVRKPFQQTVKDGSCNAMTCALDMVEVGEGKRIEVSSVSCWIAAWSNGVVYQLALKNAQTGDEDYLVPELTMEDVSTPIFTANHRTSFFAAEGQKLQIEAISRNNDIAGLSCKIAGEMVKRR